MQMVPGYWKKAFKFYSNWVFVTAGSLQTAAMTVKQTGVVIPHDLDTLCGYAVAGLMFAGVFMRGVSQEMDKEDTVQESPPAPINPPEHA